MLPTDDEFRAALRDILERSDLSMRALSAAMGRDTGYVAALLDPSRPSRARPTPADLVQASDATGIAFVELLEALWGIKSSRLAEELGCLGVGGSGQAAFERLGDSERREVRDFTEFLASRGRQRRRPNR
jgi:hypothetical protein